MSSSDKSSSHRLFGKFFTNTTPPSFDETEQSLRKQWDLSGDMTLQKLGDDDIFLFEFTQENDKKMVLNNEPHYVNGVIIVIKEGRVCQETNQKVVIKDLHSSAMTDFTFVNLFVVVVDFPPYLLYSKKLIKDLKSQVGDNNPFLVPTNSYGKLLFRVGIDLKKPLKPGFYIDENQNQNQNRFVEFKYINLGNFCYNCGMIGHVKSNCDQVSVPKERALNATSRTHVYGPWLRAPPHLEPCYQIALTKSPRKENGFCECEKTLLYAQFFIEIEYKTFFICNTKNLTNSLIASTHSHRFRFPCSYLDAETESTHFSTNTNSKAYVVLRREICENLPSFFDDFEHTLLNKPDRIESLVEQLKVIKQNEFCCDDKWLTLTLQINRNIERTPVEYETKLMICGDMNCEQLIESKISDLIKTRVERNENLLSLSSWENLIRQAISEMGFTNYMQPYYVYISAHHAMMEAVRIQISSSRCPVPADRSTVSGLERFKVLGPDMDRLDPCTICIGEMFLGEEATILPCSHVFHRFCIENWLRVGHKCPLCCFKLPSQK